VVVNALLRLLLPSRCRLRREWIERGTGSSAENASRERAKPAHWMVQRGGEREGAAVPQCWIAEGATMMRSGPSAGTTRCVRDGLGGNEWVLLISFPDNIGGNPSVPQVTNYRPSKSADALETDWLAGHVGFEPANPSASYLIGFT
jgi:hypothetical protein